MCSAQLVRTVTLCALVALIFAQCVLVPSVSARYLPTRSNTDQVRRQEIKEILRLLLDMPPAEEQQQAWNGGMYELNPAARARILVPESAAADSRSKRDTSKPIV